MNEQKTKEMTRTKSSTDKKSNKNNNHENRTDKKLSPIRIKMEKKQINQ